MSFLASRTDQNGVFVAQRRRFRVILFSSIAFGCLKSRDKEAKRRRWKQIGGSANQKRSSKTSPSDSPISRVQEEKTRFPSRPIRSVWQDDKLDASSYGQVASSRPIKSLRSILRKISKTTSSSRPIKSLRSILRTISKTTSSSRPIRILRTDLRTIFKTKSSSRPITSFRRVTLRTGHPLDGLFISANQIILAII